MEFFFPEEKIKENVIDLGRKIGYFSIGRGRNESEFSFVRPLQGKNYPRFHLLIRTDKGKSISFNLHLDQKRPVYKGVAAHSAEYDGPIIEQEAERIKGLMEL
jgi:hypothetical protein